MCRQNIHDDGPRLRSRKRDRARNQSFSRSVSRSPSTKKRRKRNSSKDSYSSKSSQSPRRRRKSRSTSRSRQSSKFQSSQRRRKHTSSKNSHEGHSYHSSRKNLESRSDSKSKLENKERKSDLDRHKRRHSPTSVRNRNSGDLRSRLEEKSRRVNSQSKIKEKPVDKKKSSRESKQSKSKSKVEKSNRKGSSKVHKKKKRKHKHKKESSVSPAIAPDSTAALSGNENSDVSADSTKLLGTISPTIKSDAINKVEDDSISESRKIEPVSYNENVIINSHKLNEIITPDVVDSNHQVEDKQSSISVVKTESSIPTITSKRPRLVRRKDFR